MTWKIYTYICWLWLFALASVIGIQVVRFALDYPGGFAAIMVAVILTLCSVTRLIVWLDDSA